MQMKRVETQPSFVMFRPLELRVPINRPRSTKGHRFEFGLRSRSVHEMESFVKGSKNPTTQTNTPKSMEKLVAKVMQANKIAELF